LATYTVDGHDIKALVDIFNEAKSSASAKPKVIIANTIKARAYHIWKTPPSGIMGHLKVRCFSRLVRN